MRVLVGCEFSGRVRDAFLRRGHDAWSCDLEPTISGDRHYQRDVRDLLGEGWDLAIFHPPCDHLAVSGRRWFHEKLDLQEEALDFVRTLLDAPIPRICLENPVGIISSKIRPLTQSIQPWMFGHGETKRTCLWLKNLPVLQPTNYVKGRSTRLSDLGGGDRARERSLTYPGIAEAMADQWSTLGGS